jgi:hypothetical protein
MPIAEQRSMAIRNVIPPHMAPTTCLNHLAPKKVTINPRTIAIIPKIQGLLDTNLTHAVAEKTGHPLLCFNVRTGEHILSRLKSTS